MKYVPISPDYFAIPLNDQNNKVDGIDANITNDEFWRFLQALSNKQYFSTFEEITSTNKDSVLINEKEVNYDEKVFDFEENDNVSNSVLIKKGKKQITQNFIIKKENLNVNENSMISSVLDKDISNIKINSVLKNINNYHNPQINNLNKSNLNQSIQTNISNVTVNTNLCEDKNFECFFDFYLKSNVQRIKNNQMIKNDIKIYTTYITTKKQISCDLDKKLLGFIIENYYEDFFDLCYYWIYQEYLQGEFHDDILKKRYDSLLEEILTLIETKKNFFKPEELNDDWLFFVSNLPKYTNRIISHMEKANSGLTKKFCDECKLNKRDPVQLKAYKNIIDTLLLLQNNQNREIAEHLLNQLLHIPKKAITSLLNLAIRYIASFYNEEDFPYKNVIVEFAHKEFEDLQNTTEENENVIKSKLGLFLYICLIEPNLIKLIPKVYSKTNDISKSIIENTFNNIIKNNNGIRSNNICDFIKNSNADSIKILLSLLKNCEGKIDDFAKNEIFKFCDKEKGFLDKILQILGDKLSEQDFHKFSILKKILYMNNTENNLESIISKFLINSNFIEKYLTSHEGISDKNLSMLYNLHLHYKTYKNYNTNSEFINVSFINNFKTICKFLIKSFSQEKNEKFNESVSQFLDIILKLEDIPIIIVSTLSSFQEIISDQRIILGNNYINFQIK